MLQLWRNSIQKQLSDAFGEGDAGLRNGEEDSEGGDKGGNISEEEDVDEGGDKGGDVSEEGDVDEGEGDLGSEEARGSKRKKVMRRSKEPGQARSKDTKEIPDEVANDTEVQSRRTSKEKTARCTPKPSTSAVLPCLPPKRPAPDSSSSNRSYESKSSRSDNSKSNRSDESKSSSQSVEDSINEGQVINLQDFSLEDQMKLSKVASTAHTMSREGSEEASREGRKRSKRKTLNEAEKQVLKRKDEENLLQTGKRVAKKSRKLRDIP